MDRTRSRPFSLDPGDITRLRDVLSTAGFDERGVAAACGIPDVSLLKDLPGELAWRRTEGDAPLATLIRLFVIGGSCSAAAVRRALGSLSLQRAVQGGLLRGKGDEVRALVRMVPCAGVIVAFDGSLPDDELEAPDHVMGPSDSARRLASLAIQEPCEDALDLGSGCGFLAFLMARHAKRVVASDMNSRAAAFAALNAGLNGADNVECLTGDLFAPVEGRQFDRIVCNPPFVISPEDRLVYLNGGMKADGFCQRIAKEAPAYLREGGHAQMLCNWIEIEGEDWQQRLRAWFEGTGCDAWVLRFSSTDPVAYAKGWMKVGHLAASAQDPARLAAWLAYYASENIGSIGSGVITMRKRNGQSWFRAFDGPERVTEGGGDAVLERLATLDFLETLRDDDALMRAVLQVSPDARLTQECTPTAEGWAHASARVRVERGLAYVEEIDTYLAELLIACDGRRSLGEAVARTAHKLGLSASDVPAETAELVRQLIDEGFLKRPPLGG